MTGYIRRFDIPILKRTWIEALRPSPGSSPGSPERSLLRMTKVDGAP
jgi:hypothetical protein